jgi:hypothetical protein
MMNRRGFLGAMIAAAAAPAIVRASSLMPVAAPKVWTPPQTLFTGELGYIEGFRFYESHVLDAMTYGIGMAKLYRPRQRKDNRTMRELLDAMPLVAVDRIEPAAIFVHPEWAHDLRKAGVPVRK